MSQIGMGRWGQCEEPGPAGSLKPAGPGGPVAQMSNRAQPVWGCPLVPDERS